MQKCKHENSKFIGRNKGGIRFHECTECNVQFAKKNKK